jgi:hypothetical protein
MANLYEVLFYSGAGMIPAYYLIDGIEGDTIEDALQNQLGSVVQQVRETFHLGDQFPVRKIYEALFVLKEDGLVSVSANT